MRNRCLLLMIALFCSGILAACGLPAARAAPEGQTPQGGSLAAYRSEAELSQALARWRDAAAELRPQRRAMQQNGMMLNAAPQSAAAAPLAKSEMAAVAAADSITNVQTAGVDEGGIVKRAGDHLVDPAPRPPVHGARRGRRAAGRRRCRCLRAGQRPARRLVRRVADLRAPRWWWSATATRVAAPRSACSIWRRRRAAHRATYHLRSFDYYSSRNYASRLVGAKLVFYTPTCCSPGGRRRRR